MDSHSLPVVGGMGGAAALAALFLAPWFAQNTNPPATTGAPVAQASTPSTGSSTTERFSLTEGELGPWHAFCKVLADSDPEDMETDPFHSFQPEAGFDIHPSLSRDEQVKNEELEEETETLPGGIQKKFVPHHHYKADFRGCLPRQAQANSFPFNFMIATIPDPLGSHLALEFDRQIVGIERAASQADFVFERYWFPWSGILKTEQATHPDNTSDVLKQQLRQQPGLLIFRKRTKPNTLGNASYTPRLLVFLVGETPTGGINKVAFSKAVVYTSQLACYTFNRPALSHAIGQDPSLCSLPHLQILGPNFSGSFSSLYHAISDAHNRGLLRAKAAHVVSPNTTVKAIQDRFDTSMNDLGCLTRLSQPDEVTQRGLLDYLHLLGYNNDEVVYLSEDETSYHPDNNDDVTLPHPQDDDSSNSVDKLTYPRDLSALRNTWAPSSVGVTPADISGESTLPRVVPFSLHEQTSNELDSPSAFATEQAAPDADQALSNLITTIRHRRYHVIIVTASNPLDQIYLLEYIHHNAADLRLVTYGQDSMMLRATNYERLRGSLSVTSYPLVDDWRLFDNNVDQFADSTTQGVAVGALLLFYASPPEFPMANMFVDALTLAKENTLIAYLHDKPGIYALGNDSFWPISNQHQSAPPPLTYRNPLVPRTWYILITILAVISIFHIRKYCHVYCPRGFRTIADNVKGSSRSEDMAEDFCLHICTTQLATMFLLFTIPSFLVLAAFLGLDGPPVTQTSKFAISLRIIVIGLKITTSVAMALWVLILTIVCMGLFVRIFRSSMLIYKHDMSPRRMRAARAYLTITSLYPLITLALWTGLLIHSNSHGDVVFRTMYTLDGLSPLPVIGAVTMVWYLFGAVGMEIVRAVKLMKVNPRILDGLPKSPSWVKDLMLARHRVLGELEAVSVSKWKGLAIFGSGYLALGLLQGWNALRGLDEWWLQSWLFFAGVGLVGVFVLVEFGRVWSVWKRLEAMFLVLSYSPLGVAFDTIPKDLTTVKVWHSPETRQPPALQRYTLSRLVELTKSAPQAIKDYLQPHISEAEVLVSSRLRKSARGDSSSFPKHRALNDRFDFCLSNGDSARQWFMDECLNNNSAALEYLASRYVAMIRYVNAQLRYILVFVLFAYVLLIVGLETYPFEGQRSISSCLTIIFMIVFVMAAVMIVQMDRNAFLSQLEHTSPGETDYWSAGKRLLGVGGIPLIAILASQFPAIERFLLSWVKPTVDSLH